jgi:hypothetical protein
LTLVLLDTNVYLRLAKRVRPLLGSPFSVNNYTVTILADVENEVLNRNSTLLYYNPWFTQQALSSERLAHTIRLTASEKVNLDNAISVFQGLVKGDQRYLEKGRSPPSRTDCKVLAFSQIRTSIIVTDDLGMHLLASETGVTVWHGYQLIEQMLIAGVIDADLVRSVYDALENNGDMTKTWADAKHTTFVAIFGEPVA